LPRGERPLTVCIAAICTWAPNQPLMIVGASDRMLSAPDIKFEPPQRKIYQFHQNAVALIAGDPYAQISICDETMRANLAKPRQTIKELADLFADAFSAHRRQIAEAKYLKPIGLDANSLMDRSPDFQSTNVELLQRYMRNEVLEADTIIAGDSIGFASIGSGKNHADSYFMMAHHTRNTMFHKALLDTYLAKKRSEVSPTVGPTTDLFYIGPTGFFALDEQEAHESLERIRSRLDGKVKAATAEAEKEAFDFMVEFTKPKAPTPSPIPAANVSNALADASARRAKQKTKMPKRKQAT
jgi:hypothetical protein